MQLVNGGLGDSAQALGFGGAIGQSGHQGRGGLNLGSSTDFAEHRQYMPGDDIRRVDWKLYARADRYYVKQFEEETNLRAYLRGEPMQHAVDPDRGY